MLREMLALSTFSSMSVALAGEPPATVEVGMHVEAPIESVWNAWSSQTGVESFFARAAVVEPHVDGRYDILFFPGNPPGQRGAEGMRLLALEPPTRLMFTWNAPPHLPEARAQRAIVEVRLSPSATGGTDVLLRHFGWGDSEQWHATRAYFAGAWPVILRRLAYRFQRGPIDWDHVPSDLVYRSRPRG